MTTIISGIMDTDDTASREQETAHESDTALKDIRVLFKDSLDKPIIRCWNEAEVCEIIHDNHETVQLVSLENDVDGNRYTATINKRLLTRFSPYFKALLEGGFSERTKKVLSIDYKDFFLQSLQDRLCTGELSILEKYPHFKTGFYLFADFYNIPALRRVIMSAAVAHTYDKPWHPINAARAVALPPSLPLYKFLVETYVRHRWMHEDRYHEMFTVQFWGIMSDFPEMINLRVSHHGSIIEIHKALLIRSSPYYRALFQGGFSDRDQEVFAMEILPENMITFRKWLYDGELTLGEDIDDYQHLIRLYIFADYYDFPALRRAIMSLFVLHNKEHNDHRVPHFPLMKDCLSQLPPTLATVSLVR
ncbi:unnamed protein product [Aureobasidium mustum]|uniref:BTB domain-containing protein n=1 Tax=Aureobasidium mustum TaxID=2773714 RepID=A0A9N8KCB4_9PEZI|nr:unnamed protein product [Aureobasidium mustum]